MYPVCYVLIFSKNNQIKRYIGSTSDIQNRFKQHLYLLQKGARHNKILQSLWNDGWCLRDETVIYPCLTLEASRKLELAFILASEDDDDVVNIAFGNDTYSHNPNKEIITERLKINASGENNSMYGKTHTQNTRNTISEKLREFYRNNESSNLGIKRSDKFKQNLSSIASQRVGSKNPFFGKNHSVESKQKMSDANKGKIPPNTRRVIINGVEYESISKASRVYGITPSLTLWRIRNKVSPRFVDWNWL